jgi:uncharacterized protein
MSLSENEISPTLKKKLSVSFINKDEFLIKINCGEVMNEKNLYKSVLAKKTQTADDIIKMILQKLKLEFENNVYYLKSEESPEFIYQEVLLSDFEIIDTKIKQNMDIQLSLKKIDKEMNILIEDEEIQKENKESKRNLLSKLLSIKKIEKKESKLLNTEKELKGETKSKHKSMNVEKIFSILKNIKTEEFNQEEILFFENLKESNTENGENLFLGPDIKIIKEEELNFGLDIKITEEENENNSKETISFNEKWCSLLINGELEELKNLLSNNKDFDINTKFPEYNNGTSLHIAISRLNNLHIIEYLLFLKLDPNIEDDMQSIPLHLSCSKGFWDTTVILLSFKSNPNTRDVYGNTPLLLALKKKYFEISNDLILFGADINIKKYNGYSIMHDIVINSTLPHKNR